MIDPSDPKYNRLRGLGISVQPTEHYDRVCLWSDSFPDTGGTLVAELTPAEARALVEVPLAKAQEAEDCRPLAEARKHEKVKAKLAAV